MNSVSFEHEANYLEYKGRFSGLLGWILSTDHKRIGLLYLYSMAVMFIIGAALGLAMRFELLAPGKTVMDAQAYNATFTVHGVIMIFMVVIPGLPAVFGNFFLPIMIGARDVAFPRLNLLSWWFYVAGVFLVLSALVFGKVLPIQAGHFMLHTVSNGNKSASGNFWGICSWIFLDTYRIKFFGYHTSYEVSRV
jgi:cytochrome c oxidase subunit I